MKLSSKPNFDRAPIFDSNLIAIHMKKTEVYFNKPIYVGQAILDLNRHKKAPNWRLKIQTVQLPVVP